MLVLGFQVHKRFKYILQGTEKCYCNQIYKGQDVSALLHSRRLVVVSYAVWLMVLKIIYYLP